MNTSPSIFRFTLLLLLATSLSAAEDWQTIFDGKSLAGWKSNPENPDSFSIIPGGILKVSGKRSHLFYVGDRDHQSFSDFELKLKVKTLPNANSGVFFHTRFQDSGWPAHGHEAQINTTHGDPRKTGSIYGVVDCWVDPVEFTHPLQKAFITVDPQAGIRLHQPNAPTRDMEWFDYHIKVVGKTITIKVNGGTIVEYTEPENVSGTRRLSAGTIALQAHDPGSTIFYQDIKLKLLD